MVAAVAANSAILAVSALKSFIVIPPVGFDTGHHIGRR
ncbi:hypothetical protein Pd630_LPD02910 [Rhodococcus opacus PD630]|nr:hypothetical protein Pd630_LPD02910 [Rhodococcus opacus PD630]